MGNQLQKEYNVKEKPLKLPGSYSFLRFIHHPTEELSLIIIKHPHRATPIPSTLILPIKEVRPLQSNDSLAICHKCLPLCLVKPKSETQMRILMHKILKSSTQIGRCFFYLGRVMLWCQEKRGLSSISPQQLQYGKHHDKSKVFTSGISLINFLHCVYEENYAAKKELGKSKNDKSFSSKEKSRERAKPKGQSNQSLPSEVKLFFDPKDKKEYFDLLSNIENRLKTQHFWQAISEGLRELLLNMIGEDPDKRIQLQLITSIPYFMESNQLRLYATLTDDLETMSSREAKLFMSTLELIVQEGLTIENTTMDDFFKPVLCSMVSYNQRQGTPNDYIVAMVLSILIEFDKPPVEVIHHGFKKAHQKNLSTVRLALSKKRRLFEIMTTEYFDSILSRAIFCSFQSQQLMESVVEHIPFAMRNLKQANYRKEIEYQLIHRILLYPVDKLKPILLLDALKCTIHLLKQQLLTSPQKLDILIYPPQKLTIELNFHVLYLYGLIIQNLSPQDLLEKMMPKLQLYLNDLDLYDELFVVAKRCVDRILQRLYEQRKIKVGQLVELEKDELYFEMRAETNSLETQEKKALIKKQIEKHELSNLKWVSDLL